MASNLAKRLDRLERLIRERTQPDTSPFISVREIPFRRRLLLSE